MEPSKPTNDITVNQSQPVVVSAAPVFKPTNTAYLKKLRWLAIAEIVLGSICTVLGAAIAGLVDSGPYRYRHYRRYYSSFNRRYVRRFTYRYVNAVTYGEGIWCGIFIVVAGILGLRLMRAYGSRCLVTTHMAFSIVGSVFSGILFIMGVLGALGGELVKELAEVEHFLGLYSILCVLAFISMVLLIISAVYSCSTLGYFDEQGCCRRGLQGCNDGSGQECSCCMPYNGQAIAYGGAHVVMAHPNGGGQAVSYIQPPRIVGQQLVYAQQPPIAGQPVAYVQQPAMLTQGTQNISEQSHHQGGGDEQTANSPKVAMGSYIQPTPPYTKNQEPEPNYENISPKYQ